LSNHPTRDAFARKSYLPPAFTKLFPTKNPSPSLPDKVRSSLKELDAILRANPDDSEAAQLQQALRHMLEELESKPSLAAP
jgi:hypothetical protein